MNGRTATAAAAAAPRPAQPRAARGGRRPVTWPLFSALGPVGALPTAPALARGFTSAVLGGWAMNTAGDLADVSELIVSEMVTNVVQGSTRGDGLPAYHSGRLAEFWLRLMTDRGALRVEVWDDLPAAAGAPALQRPGTADEHGRGLGIIAQLSSAWGWQQVPGTRFKCVWALLGGRPARGAQAGGRAGLS